MRKIPTLFMRDPRLMSKVTEEVNPVAQWVIDGEGVATQKMDGTSCLVQDGKLWKRRSLGAGAPEPEGFLLAEHDENTDKKFGWMPVGDGPEDKLHRDGFTWLLLREQIADFAQSDHLAVDGETYELCGPGIQSNPERFGVPVLLRHSSTQLVLTWQPPRDFEGIRFYLGGQEIEGIVWHHPDGRMAKAKARDFGVGRGR